ncbi:MAG: lytic murein transglycosylase B [Betaproteobacteria bacterium]|nr:MAG: lytic murein transglycosylase B [Betaproteobacteria bacterium]
MARGWFGKTVRDFSAAVVQRHRAGSRGLVIVALSVLALVATTLPAQAQNVQVEGLKPEVNDFVMRMSREHGFDAVELGRLFGQLEANQTIIRAFNAPATARPWSYFRKLYVTSSRVEGGVEFWDEHSEVLERASNFYGVPEEIIVSIIGVETIYGQYTGKFRIVDALYTLGFEVPRRSQFFQGQFEHFLLLTRENGLDAGSVTGSFAGAMGIPQFMPSSYRQYAVDFDGDGRVDLLNSVADAVGSVANYLSRFGWEEGEQIVLPAKVSTNETEKLERLGTKPSLTVAQLRSRGVEADGNVADDVDAGFFSLEAEQGPLYFVSLKNFYVITRYNRSNNYAMAVYQLAQEIARQRVEQMGTMARVEGD